MDLIIVESPTKARELAHFLPKSYRIVASMGHVRDLPVNGMGVAPPGFAPEYVPTDRGKGVLASLRKDAAAAERVFLASDPDREGEAIAWHIQDALRLPKKKTARITYTEITESAVKRALQHPRDIDMHLVAAQEARRVADRIIGYGVSPALCQAGNARLSAGRVQTPALRLIVEREEAIRAHSTTRHFSAVLLVEPGFEAQWNRTPYLKGSQYVMDRDLAERAASLDAVSVTRVTTQRKTTMPPAPFSTSAFQQACSAKLDIGPEMAMRIAQNLFETGRITYMRTDSTNLSEEAVTDIRRYAEDQGLPLPKTPNVFRTRTRNAQEAHEAIRPTNMSDEGANLNGDARRVYALIHRQTLLCQLAPLVESVTQADFSGTHLESGETFQYKAAGFETLEPGFTALTQPEEKPGLPALREGDTLDVRAGTVQELKTQPASRFTEATFIAELERRGIGRPSTWAAILATLYFRQYIEKRGKSVAPTPKGSAVAHALSGTKFAQYEYTANMEEVLDGIADGKKRYVDCVAEIFADSQRDARAITPFTVPGEVEKPARAQVKRRETGDNPATRGTGTRTRKVTLGRAKTTTRAKPATRARAPARKC